MDYGHHAYAQATYAQGDPHGQLHHRRHNPAYPSNAKDGGETSSFDKLPRKVTSQARSRDIRPFKDKDEDKASTSGGGLSDNCMSGEDEGSSDSGTNRDCANSAAVYGDGEGDDRVNLAVRSLLTLLASADEGSEVDQTHSRQRKRSRTETHHAGASNSTAAVPRPFEAVHGIVPHWVEPKTGIIAVRGWVAKPAKEWQFHFMRDGCDIV